MTVDRVDPDQGPQSGEIATRQETPPAVSSHLTQFAVDARAAYQVAVSIAKTTFVPTSYKKRGRGQNATWLPPEEVAQNVTAAWLAGDEVGIKPMQALQAINLIEGTPALSAQAMRALVQSHGHEVWIEDQSQPNAGAQQIFATVAGRRKGTEHIERVTWTWQRARQNDLTGKDNWQRDPLAMCIARSTSAICRLIASDVLMGLAYSAEELTDDPETLGMNTEEAPRPAASTSVQRKSAQADQKPTETATTPQDTAAAATPVGAEQGGGDPTDQGGPTPEKPAEHAEPADPATQELSTVCGEPRQDGKAFCDRPSGHPPRHRYNLSEDPRPKPEPSPDPNPAEERDQESGEQIPEDPEGEGLFPEVSAEELEKAYEAEQAARTADQPVQPAPPRPGVQDTGLPVDGDDPWAEFR